MRDLINFVTGKIARPASLPAKPKFSNQFSTMTHGSRFTNVVVYRFYACMRSNYWQKQSICAFSILYIVNIAGKNRYNLHHFASSSESLILKSQTYLRDENRQIAIHGSINFVMKNNRNRYRNISHKTHKKAKHMEQKQQIKCQ